MKYCYSTSVIHQLPGYQTINYLTLRHSQGKLISYGWNSEAGQRAALGGNQSGCEGKNTLENSLTPICI